MKRRNLPGVPTACVIQDLGAAAQALLEKALHEAGFWDHLDRTRSGLGLAPDDFRVLIKPDLDVYDPSLPDCTDPALVEHLIDLLHDHGLRDVVVGDGRNESDAWLQNREPLVVPELAGYRFATPRGRAYEIVDLASDLDDAGIPISRHWLGAHYRINFAKNRTHEEYAYALCVHNLAGLSPTKDAQGQPRFRSACDDCLVVLRRAPPHFNIIDAFTSCHGRAGQRAPRALRTHAFVASVDAVLADWAGAAKMALDPYASPVNATALRHVGLPADHVLEGDLSPYPLWRNVHPLVSHAARLRSSSEILGPMSAAWFQSIDRERFAFREFYDDRINSFGSPLMARLDENARSLLAVVLLDCAIGWIGLALDAQQTMFSKHKVRRRIAPLRLDVSAFGRSDFEAIPGYLRPYEQLLAAFPANKAGLRWRHIDGSVLFTCSHVFPIPFERFVEKVDITRAIQYMNDNIGGSTVAARRDARGRVVHQAERNIYLPQPNWMVIFGGDFIDVEKIERIEYRKRAQAMTWRTVGSPNGSALYDDGSVAFRGSGAGRTTVTIFARQQFSLPLLFKVFDVNLAPEFRDSIIESAYANFFAGTIANLQAAYEGREFRIGRDAGAREAPRLLPVGEVSRHVATAAAAVVEGFRQRDDVARFSEWFARPEPGARPAEDAELDLNGFRHFRPSDGPAAGARARDKDHATIAGLAALMRDAPDFVNGLADAVRKDLDRVAASPAAGASP